MASLGRAYIEIVADAKGFGPSVRREVSAALRDVDFSGLTPSAAAAGVRAGRAASDGINTGLRTGRRAPLDLDEDSLVASALRAGQNAARAITRVLADDARQTDIDIDPDALTDSARAAAVRAGEALVERLRKQVGDADIDIDFDRLVAVAGNAGERIGDEFGDRLTRATRRSTDDVDRDAGSLFSRVTRTIASSFTQLASTIAAETNGIVGSLARITSGLSVSASEAGPAGLAILATALSGLASAAIAAAAVIVQAFGVIFAVPAGVATLVAILGTLKLAFQGVTDAVSLLFEQPQDPEKLQSALENLSPAARAVVLELQPLADSLRAIQRIAQENFFAPLVGALGTLRPLIATVQAGIGTLSTALGTAARSLVDFFASAQGQGTIAAIFDQAAASVTRLGPALLTLITAFSGFIERSGPGMQILVDFVARLIEGFAGFLDSLSEDDITTFVGRGVLALQSLLGLFRALGGAILSVFGDSGVQDSGRGLIDTLTMLTDRVTAFFNSVEGQESLDNLARNVGLVATAFVIVSNVIGATVSFLRTFSNAIDDMSIRLSDAARAIRNFGNQALTALGAVRRFFTGLPAVIGAALTAAGDFFAALPGRILGFIAVVGSAVTTFFSSLPKRVVDLVKRALDEGLNAIGIGLGLIAFAVLRLPGLILDSLQSLAGSVAQLIGGAFTSAGDAAETAGTGIVDFALALPARILGALGSLTAQLGDFFATVWNNARTIFLNGTNAVAGFAASLPGRVVSALSSLPGLISNVFASIWSTVNLIVANGLNGIVDFFSKLPGRIGAVLGSIGSNIWDALKKALNVGIDLINKTINGFNKVPGIPHIPPIERLANGALILSERVVRVGEAGAEVVIPLTRPRRAAELARQSGLLDVLDRGGMGGSSRTVNINAPITVVTPASDPRTVALQVSARLARLAAV